MAQTYQQHPLSAAFPRLDADEFEALVADIRTNGQKEAVIVLDNMVLDGWNRYLACEKAKKKCATMQFPGGDPIAFVLSRNLHRRHLTASQRAAAVVAASQWRPAGQPRNPAPGAGFSEAEMAKAAEVGERTIRQAKVAERAGLGDKVRDGTLSAKAAAESVRPTKPAPSAGSRKPAQSTDYEALYKTALADLEEAREAGKDVGETARELEDKLSALEIKDPDDQQKEILRLRNQVAKLEAEIERLTRSRNDAQAKTNELIRQVKRLQRGGRN